MLLLQVPFFVSTVELNLAAASGAVVSIDVASVISTSVFTASVAA